MGKHTPEPWKSHEHMVFQGEHGGFSLRNDRNNAEDARRIVACVNACRGLPTDELEQKGLVAAVGTQLLDVERQRDKMQELIDELLDKGLFFFSAIERADDDIDFREWEVRARAAKKSAKVGEEI